MRPGVLGIGNVSRQPFPNNVIPTNRLNPIALKYLQYFPLPNTPGLANGSQNFLVNAVDSDGYDNELGRLDVNVSDKNKLSFDARHNYRAQNKNQFFGNAATGNFLYRINQGFGLSDVHTFSPTVFMEVRANYTRYQEHHFSPADTVSPNDLGFSSLTWRQLPSSKCCLTSRSPALPWRQARAPATSRSAITAMARTSPTASISSATSSRFTAITA